MLLTTPVEVAANQTVNFNEPPSPVKNSCLVNVGNNFLCKDPGVGGSPYYLMLLLYIDFNKTTAERKFLRISFSFTALIVSVVFQGGLEQSIAQIKTLQ